MGCFKVSNTFKGDIFAQKVPCIVHINRSSFMSKAIFQYAIFYDGHFCKSLMLNGRSKDILSHFMLKYLQPRAIHEALHRDIIVIENSSTLLSDNILISVPAIGNRLYLRSD